MYHIINANYNDILKFISFLLKPINNATTFVNWNISVANF